MNINRFLPGIAVAFASGAIAGALAARVVVLLSPELGQPIVIGAATSTPPVVPATSTAPVISLVPVERRSAVPLLPPAFVKRHSSGIGTLYRKPKGTSLEDRMLGDDRILGRAVSLTSDGWFVTAAGNFDGVRLADVVLFHDGSSYAIERGVIDHLSSVAFFHVQASGFTSPAFAQMRETTLGAEVWVEDRPNGYVPGVVLDQGGRVAPNDPLSSEIAARRIVLDVKTGATDRGAAAWDPNGTLVGIIESKSGEDVRLIPASVIAGSLASLLQSGDIQHALLGVRAIDLGTAKFDGSREGLPRLGALIRDDKKAAKPGVKLESPAAIAKLKVGDVILRVERDILDGTVDLGEVLAEYHAGTAVTLRVRRDANEIDVPVTLGSVVTSEAMR